MTATDELATILFALDTGTLSTKAVTRLITRQIVQWALARGWHPLEEGRISLPTTANDRLHAGYVDILVRRSPDEPAVAIEIDSTQKPWSVTKLRHAAAAGMHAIWVRWGDAAWAGIYDEVDVIQLPLRRRPAPPGRATDQLTVWW